MNPVKKKSYRFRAGLQSVVIYHHAKGWRWLYRDETGKRQYVTRSKKADAEDAALRHFSGAPITPLPAHRMEFLRAVADAVPESEQAEVLELLRARSTSTTAGVAITRYEAYLRSRGRSGKHVRMTIADLGCLETTAKLGDYTAARLEECITKRIGTAGPRRWNAVRIALVGLFRWGRDNGMIPNAARTAADMVNTRVLPATSRRIITRDELDQIFELVPASLRLWVALAAWAGLRPEEIAPSREKLADGKRGLTWADVDLHFKVIRVSTASAKGGKRPRIVPIADCLLAALKAVPASKRVGPVCPHNAGELRVLPEVAQAIWKTSWPGDCLRHSYGSYRNAILRDLGRVAEEMGNSVAMLHAHYHNPEPEEKGVEWFRKSSAKAQKLFAQHCDKIAAGL